MFPLFVKAQDKVVEFKPANKHTLLQSMSVQNGTTYIVTGREKSPKSEVKIVCYDSLLNVKYSKDILSNYKGLPAFFGRGMNESPIYYDLMSTNTGKVAISNKDKIVFDENGNVKDFKFEDVETENEIYNRFSFLNDDYAFLSGEKKKKKVKKRTLKNIKYTEGALKIFQHNFMILTLQNLITNKKLKNGD